MKTRTSIYHRTFAFAYVLLVAVIFCGCNPQPENGSSETSNGDYVTKVIDSCEYIGYINAVPHDILTHKGNCRFCKQRNTK